MVEKGYLIDWDTLSKWIFQAERHAPVLRWEEIPVDVVRYTPFFAVPDYWMEARHWTETIRNRIGQQNALEFEEQARATALQWFSEWLFVQYADEPMVKRWVDLASLPPVHKNTNREHVWLVVVAQELRDRGCQLTIVSEEPEVYLEFRDVGALDEIAIFSRP